MTAASTPLISIAPLSEHPEYVDTVAAWVFDEWHDSTLEEYKATLIASANRPGALVAIADAQPIGLLSFKRYPLQKEGSEELWVNVVYVVEPWRGRGVGSQLLHAGVAAAGASGCGTLSVYTNVPRFYERHGWKQIRRSAETGMFVFEHAM